MLKEKVINKKFNELEEVIEILRGLPKELELESVIRKIKSVDGANYGTIKNEETWGYSDDCEFFIKEVYEKQTSAGASMYDESLRAHVEMSTEELNLSLEIKCDDEVRNLIDAPYRAESFGAMTLSYNFK